MSISNNTGIVYRDPRIFVFTVSGDPKGQPRPRAFYNKRTGRASVFDASTAEGWKAAVAAAASRAIRLNGWAGEYPTFTGALRVATTFYFKRPKRHFNTKGELRPFPPELYTSKPDSDNLEKAVWDVLTQLQVWDDDSQICENTTKKFYSTTNDGFCGAIIQIEELVDFKGEVKEAPEPKRICVPGFFRHFVQV
jgi:Holliday junction resolvase RusA-like endonuclease